jgi:hypothetical protein
LASHSGDSGSLGYYRGGYPRFFYWRKENQRRERERPHFALVNETLQEILADLIIRMPLVEGVIGQPPPEQFKHRIGLVVANLVNLGLTTAEDATPHFGFDETGAYPVCWSTGAGESRPIVVVVDAPDFPRLQKASPDEVGEYLRKNYFEHNRERSIRSSIVGSAILAFAIEGGRKAIVPNPIPNGTELPHIFEAPELAISMDGYPSSKVSVEPFKFRTWDEVGIR